MNNVVHGVCDLIINSTLNDPRSFSFTSFNNAATVILTHSFPLLQNDGLNFSSFGISQIAIISFLFLAHNKWYKYHNKKLSTFIIIDYVKINV